MIQYLEQGELTMNEETKKDLVTKMDKYKDEINDIKKMETWTTIVMGFSTITCFITGNLILKSKIDFHSSVFAKFNLALLGINLGLLLYNGNNLINFKKAKADLNDSINNLNDQIDNNKY